jgi:hypothetical protein
VARVERLVRERRSGRALSFADLSALDWELILVWDARDEEHRRAHEMRVAMLCEALFARGG